MTDDQLRALSRKLATEAYGLVADEHGMYRTAGMWRDLAGPCKQVDDRAVEILREAFPEPVGWSYNSGSPLTVPILPLEPPESFGASTQP